MKPVLLLDVDGVINATAVNPDLSVWPEEAWLRCRVRAADDTWPILAARPVIAFINKIHDEGLVDVRWHTTWQWHAKRLADRIGLQQFPIADAPEYDDDQHFVASLREGRPTWWKLPAALRVLQEERRPLIWIDDDLNHELRHFDWPIGIPQLLTITPNGIEGITARHIQKITAFIDEVTG